MRTFNNKFHTWEFKTVFIDDAVKALKYIKMLEDSPVKLWGFDIETEKSKDHLEHAKAGLCPLMSAIRLVQIYDGAGIVYVFDVRECSMYMFKALFKQARFVAHNAIFEIKHLIHNKHVGINIGCSLLLSQLVYAAEHAEFEIETLPGEDTDQTGLATYKKPKHSLDACIQREFGVKVDKLQQASDWGKDVLSEEQIAYAGLDAVLTYHLALKLSGRLKAYKMQKIYQLQKDMQHVIAKMELTGLPVDWEYHSTLIEKWKVQEAKALEDCQEWFEGVNMRSGKQMNEWLKKYLSDQPALYARWPRTDKCKCSTPIAPKPCVCGAACTFDKKAIAEFKHLPAIAALLKYKKVAILLSTFGESLVAEKHPVTGRLHTSYTLGYTSTGRLSSRNPNLQNMPHDEEFRNIFCAKKHHVLVVADFSQIELRLQAEFSKDKFMCSVYKNNQDFYEKTASAILGQNIAPLKETDEKKWKLLRNSAGKVPALALGYGMGSKKLGKYALGLDIVQPQAFWDRAYRGYYDLVPDYINWCQRMRKRAEQLGYIETLYGRRRKLASNQVYTAAPNTVIQGSAAELMIKSLLNCAELCAKDEIEIVVTVHDEIALHCHQELADKASGYLSSAMDSAMMELFPNAVSHKVADAEYGERWGTIKAGL